MSTTLTLKEVRDQAIKSTVNKMEMRKLGFYCETITLADELGTVYGGRKAEGGKPGSPCSLFDPFTWWFFTPPTALMLLGLEGGQVSSCSSLLFPNHSLPPP